MANMESSYKNAGFYQFIFGILSSAFAAIFVFSLLYNPDLKIILVSVFFFVTFLFLVFEYGKRKRIWKNDEEKRKEDERKREEVRKKNVEFKKMRDEYQANLARNRQKDFAYEGSNSSNTNSVEQKSQDDKIETGKHSTYKHHTDDELKKIMREICKPRISQMRKEEYDDSIEKAAIYVVKAQSASMAMLQREFRISSAKSGVLMHQLEKLGIVGAMNGTRPRTVLISNEKELQELLVKKLYHTYTVNQHKDELFNDAARLVVASQFGSTSLLQRKFQLGYNRAGRIIDQLESAGIIGPSNGVAPRSVMIADPIQLELFLSELNSVSPNDLDVIEQNAAPLSCNNEILTVADELFSFSQHLETNKGFLEELDKHNIQVNANGKPLCGENGKVRSLFFIDIAHCYLEMADKIDLKGSDGIGVLYLTFRLFEPNTPVSHDKQYLEIIKNSMPSGAESIINQMRNKPFFHDGDVDFTVAVVLKRFDKDLFKQYLTILYRFCSLVAKTDGKITPKEQSFIDHIAQLKMDTVSNNDGVKTIQPNDKKDHFEELDQLIGLEGVKQEVRTMSNFIKIQLSRQQQGLKISPVSYHCVFTGNPGTGKTTVARIIAGIYAELGVLKKGHLVETDRSGLVAEYVGQTAIKTNKVIDSAIDGVLFIDEAYSLVGGGQSDYGKEAIATLLKRMEDDRDRLVVILAGYGDEMKHFIDSNPGLQSRFNRYIYFPDYSAEELHQIFCSLVKKYDYELTDEASFEMLSCLKEAVVHKDKNFGNGRTVRNIFEKTLERQANRLASIARPSLKQLKEITKEDCVD